MSREMLNSNLWPRLRRIACLHRCRTVHAVRSGSHPFREFRDLPIQGSWSDTTTHGGRPAGFMGARPMFDELSQAVADPPPGCTDRRDRDWSYVSERTLSAYRSTVDRRRGS